jgi:polyferredoxin
MDKIGYSRGLVKYSTQNAVKLGWSQAQIVHHIFRPRVLIYTSILATVLLAMFVSLGMRIPFKVDVVRDRAIMSRVSDDGRIENLFRLQIMNATESTQAFRISVSGMAGLSLASNGNVSVDSAQSRWVVLSVLAPNDSEHPGSQPIHFEIESLNGLGTLHEKSVFLMPH